MDKKNPLWEQLEADWSSSEFIFVNINHDQIEKIAGEWSDREFEVPSWREEVFPDDPDEFLEFIGIANSINFCFLDPYNPRQGRYFFNWRGRKWEGAFGMAAALRAAMEDGSPILDPGFLRNLSKYQAVSILCKHSIIPLFDQRLMILKQVGNFLKEFASGGFREIFEEGKWQAFNDGEERGIVNLLIDLMPSFYDEGCCFNGAFGNIFLPFHKRAQLLLMVYQGRALSDPENYNFIKDYELLGPPADYELPKVLRCLGILEYSQELANKVDGLEIIRRDSLEEYEIRVKTIQAMLKLLDSINARRGDNKINMLGLDYKIWSAGQNLRNVNHHLTPTIAY